MADSGSGDKTEKPTPKRRADARKEGQVARSMDMNGAIVLLASLMVLSAMAPRMMDNLKRMMSNTLMLIQTPDVVTKDGLGPIVADNTMVMIKVIGPIAAVCLGAGLIVIAALAMFPKLDELAALVGMPPEALLPHLAHLILGIAQRAGAAYLVIAFIDYAWQKYRHEKQMKMSKQEIKEEAKSQDSPAEVKQAIRRRQMEQARKRMMDDVPTADVVVTNPTHYSVALRYDGEKLAPEVVAKGKDLIAFQIRKIAKEHGVPVIADPPLARRLHKSVAVGHQIPEEFFQAVAQLLAFVYRVAGRKVV